MRVLVAGANGNTAKRLIRRLVSDGRHDVIAMIRNPAQKPTFDELGVSTVVGDLEDRADTERVVADVDAVVFAAGSGSKTGPDKTLAVDLIGAIRLADAAEAAGVERFVMLSSVNADPWSEGQKISHYYRAKGIADFHLQQSGMKWVIVRPGRLTDEPGTGKITAGPDVERAEIPREDVAAVLAAAIDRDDLTGKTFVIVGGETAIDDALSDL